MRCVTVTSPPETSMKMTSSGSALILTVKDTHVQHHVTSGKQRQSQRDGQPTSEEAGSIWFVTCGHEEHVSKVMQKMTWSLSRDSYRHPHASSLRFPVARRGLVRRKIKLSRNSFIRPLKSSPSAALSADRGKESCSGWQNMNLQQHLFFCLFERESSRET